MIKERSTFEETNEQCENGISTNTGNAPQNDRNAFEPIMTLGSFYMKFMQDNDAESIYGCQTKHGLAETFWRKKSESECDEQKRCGGETCYKYR
jgi:hypothetical protein